MYMNNFRRFIVLMGLALTLLVGSFTAPAFAQSQPAQQEATVEVTDNFKIGTGLPGAPLFTVKLKREPCNNLNQSFGEKGFVTGTGEITQAGNPPLNIKTNLEGTYTIPPFVIGGFHPINFLVTGYPSTNVAQDEGIANVELSIQVTKFGSQATYEYSTSPDKPWQIVKDIPVKSLTDTNAK